MPVAPELERLSRHELIARAQRFGVPRPELMTRVELTDEIVRRSETDPTERKRARGWLGMGLLLAATIGIGWVCGGPTRATRKSLAVTTGVRNAAVALVIVSGNFADTAAVTAVVAYGIASILATLVYAFLFASVIEPTGCNPIKPAESASRT